MSKIKSARTLREPAELVARGLVPAVDLPDLEKVAARYAVAVTADLAALIDPRDPDDPIARQFIPSAEELVTQRNEDADPIFFGGLLTSEEAAAADAADKAAKSRNAPPAPLKDDRTPE